MANEWLASRRWPDLKGAGSAEFVREGTALLVKGHRASARMDAVATHVKEALREGVAPHDMLVACADPSGAARMRQKLRALEISDADRVPIVTCRELACDVIRQPEAAQATGLTFCSQQARLLCAYETDFVMEDVKTLGTRPKRLRELLKFLYRGWTELSDEDPEWLFMVEEIDTFEFLSEELAYLGAVMEPQISNLATKALRMDAGLRRRFARRRLFVLDYQNLSRASQLMCQLVAEEHLVAVVDDTSCAEVYESYPYLQGVEEFAHLNPACTSTTLDDTPAQQGTGGGALSYSEYVWDMPQDEIDGMADVIADAVKEGLNPSDVGVMTLHPWWARSMARALAALDVPVNAWYGPLKLRGDVRDFDRCLALHVVTLLRLIADPHDAVAWRSWFGFGDYLTRSKHFTDMRTTRLSTAYPGDVRRDLDAFGYDLGSDLDPLFDQTRALRGPELVVHLVRTLAGEGASVPPVLKPLLALGLDADAAHMVAELDRRQFFAGIPDREGVVVSSYTSMADLDFAQLYAVGFVNGLFPSTSFFDLTKVSINKQEKMGAQDTRTAHAMARLGREGVCVSRFTRADHEFAERAGLRQARIFAANDTGVQLSEIEPSIYTDVLLGRA